MRICLYNATATFIFGGLETYCWELGRALARRGHRVTIVAGDRGGAWHDEVGLVQFPVRVEQSWPDLGTRFRRLMERLSLARSGGLAHLVSAGYDAVIVNKPFDFPVLWLARRLGMKARTLFRSGGTEFFAGDRFFAGAVDHWVSTSRYNASQLEKRYRRPVRIIYNGVDVERFAPPADASTVSAGGRTIVSVGRLVGWKGLHIVIAALARLPPDVRYVAIGEGPEERSLRQLAVRLGVADRVNFVGRVPHADLPGWLARADVFVQPSIGEEAFGISVVEAMACGLPVLAAANGGMKEIVQHEITGRLLPVGDVAAWSSALSDLLADVARRRTMGRAARQRVLDCFTWSANAAAVEEVLSKPPVAAN